MAVKLGVLARLEAKPGKGHELASFLKQGRQIAAAEEGTVTWYAFKLGENSFGIFDTFEDEAGRDAHVDGEIPKALAQVAPELLAEDPDIQLIELVAVK